MKFYINTPIYYVNDQPHIGHAYTTIAADAVARFHRLKKNEVFFSVGVDENSQKNVQAMEKAGEKDLTTYLDRMAGVWKQTWQDLGITFTDFIRTTDERHRVGVERFWNAAQKNGDLYEKEYEGLYCVGCEAFKTETEIVNRRCPLHPNKDLENLKEKNWFFKLEKYKKNLLELIDHKDFVHPESRRNEIRNYIENHLADISVSREAKKLKIGIPVPGDESQRIYVWFDALLNYLTVIGYGTNDEMFKKWWPSDLWIGGKDIIKFHCALFPAMLMSAAKQDPLLQDTDGQALLVKQCFAHGFFTIDGQKVSKSLGNAINPRELASEYGIDALRYFLLREITFGEDGDFSVKRCSERYDADLGNTFGNLVNRTIAMSKKYFDGKVPQGMNQELRIVNDELCGAVHQAYVSNRCDLALEKIWDELYQANKYIEETQPFKKEHEAIRAPVLYSLLEACRWYAWMVYPVMPETAEKIWGQLGLNVEKELSKGWDVGLKWGGLPPGQALGEPEPLFPRLP